MLFRLGEGQQKPRVVDENIGYKPRIPQFAGEVIPVFLYADVENAVGKVAAEGVLQGAQFFFVSADADDLAAVVFYESFGKFPSEPAGRARDDRALFRQIVFCHKKIIP